MLNIKKQSQSKTVHRLTQKAVMKFRPLHYQIQQQANSNVGVVAKVSSILEKFFTFKPEVKSNSKTKDKRSSKSEIIQGNKKKNKKYLINQTSIKSRIQIESDFLREQKQASSPKLSSNKRINIISPQCKEDKNLIYLQKITIDTFLIGNKNQLDLITINVVENVVDTELNWSLNIHKKINKLSIDAKKCLLALQTDEDILIYKFDTTKMKSSPNCICKTKVLEAINFLIFLKDSQIGVFYETNAIIYQIEESNIMRVILNKKYEVNENLQLYQIPKPFQHILNIFFIQKSSISQSHVLWRLQFDFKSITSNHRFKSIVRVYNIPDNLLNKFTIDNYSKDIIILNFKFEILAARDGFIIDTANTNIQKFGSCLIYHGDYLLHISQTKFLIYKFSIHNTKPEKIEIKSLDSIEIQVDSKYSFLNCLQMLNGNFVLFFQINPQSNNKSKGQIQYLITVTQKLSIQQKLNQIFSFKNPNELKQIAQHNFEKILQKSDMAFKIGLTKKQVYLELWNKSNKKDIQDFKFLLDTMDYVTIKQEIQKKLKKSAMTFNEVYKIQHGCFSMLRQDLFSNSNCTQSAIKNYLISHFLLRKLAYFRDININNTNNMKNAVIINSFGVEQVVKTFHIDIQQYFQCVKLELRSHFIEYVTKICFQQKKCSNQVRLFIKSFKFPLRVIYVELLQSLIIQSKNKLLIFLREIPDILPYTTQVVDGQDPTLYYGLWNQINKQQWGKNLHIEQVSTIYNKDFIEQITKTVWFKRNQYSLHDLVALSKQKIIEIQQFNDSDNIFYFFIDKIFLYSKDQHHLTELIIFIEETYNRLPSHLKGKIFLYKKLYNYFIKQRYSSSNITTFDTFLKLKDYELFKQLFKYQKIKKGCLLKDAKCIYQSVKDGSQLYNCALLNYFSSSLSEVSDLKYILNRLNNEKRQFHILNEAIYTVLVKAIQLKIKIGSQQDIPLEEVMIYIENIPLSKKNPIIQDLQTLQKINEQVYRFRKMKLNMSLDQIINNCEDVITAMVNEQIHSKKVLQIRNQQILQQVSYGIIAQIQTIKDKIYKNSFRDLVYFLYLSKIMQEKQMIKYADMLLKDQYLLDYYSVDQRIIQNLVLYMYKWKFNQNPIFKDNQEYLKELLNLLPSFSECRHYIQSEIQFALMLTTDKYPIQYPITKDNAISKEEITQIIKNFTVQDILKIDIERLHELVKQMQQLCIEFEMTKAQQIYQIIITRLLELNDVKHSIPLIRKLIENYSEQETYAVVYCFNILSIIMNEISEVHKQGLLRIAFYTFNNPHILLNIVEKRLNSKFSNNEEEEFLESELENVKILKCYRKSNVLFDEQVMVKINQNEQKYFLKFQQLIFQTWAHVNNNRQDFIKNFEFTYFYIMLLNNPYALAKYISIKQESINIRILRSYLSYIFRQDIFNGYQVLLFGRRLFTIALDNIVNNIAIQILVSQLKGNQLTDDQFPYKLIEEKHQPSSFQAKLQKSIITFDKKVNSQKTKKSEDQQKKKQRVEALLSSQASINQNQISNYPFNDSDDNYDDDEFEEEKKNRVTVLHKKKAGKGNFDPNKERQMIMARKDKNLALYLSSTSQEEFDLRKTAPKILQSSKIFQNYSQSIGANIQKYTSNKDIILQQKRQYFQNIAEAESIDNMSKDQQICSHARDDFQLYAKSAILRPKMSMDGPSFKSFNNSPQRSEQMQNRFHEQLYEPQSPIRIMSNEICQQDNFEGEIENQIKVNIKKVDDKQNISAQQLAKILIQNVKDNENNPIFNLQLIKNQQGKSLSNFNKYLKDLIICIYQYTKPLSFLLILIRQIKDQYPQLNISNQFLQYYIALGNHNNRYTSEQNIRQMFPIQGIFLDSKDPIQLFQFAKRYILNIVQYDQIFVVGLMIANIFKKTEAKDELYLSFLAMQIEKYGNDTTIVFLQLQMLRQKIQGMLMHITMTTLIIQRSQSILQSVSIIQRRLQIAEMIKQTLKKKKKEYLITQFQKKIANVLKI